MLTIENFEGRFAFNIHLLAQVDDGHSPFAKLFNNPIPALDDCPD
jgi:hypothetical protein